MSRMMIILIAWQSIEWFFLLGAGFGPGIPGLQVGFGFGAGCGIGLGFGYGVGRGIAYGEHHTYSNVGRLFGHRHLPVQ